MLAQRAARARAEASFREACGLKVNARHADKKITRSQTRHDGQIQRLIKRPLTNGLRDRGREPLHCQSRHREERQRSMANGGKAETYGTRFRYIGVEIYAIAERVEFTREVEHVKATGSRDRDTNSSGHRRTIIRVVGPNRFGLFMNGGTNNPERMSS